LEERGFNDVEQGEFLEDAREFDLGAFDCSAPFGEPEPHKFG